MLSASFLHFSQMFDDCPDFPLPLLKFRIKSIQRVLIHFPSSTASWRILSANTFLGVLCSQNRPLQCQSIRNSRGGILYPDIIRDRGRNRKVHLHIFPLTTRPAPSTHPVREATPQCRSPTPATPRRACRFLPLSFASRCSGVVQCVRIPVRGYSCSLLFLHGLASGFPYIFRQRWVHRSRFDIGQ